jgi:hypothetical protein
MGLAYPLKTIVARYPMLALPVARVRRHGEVVGPHTDLVIEGFPRTGTTFAVAAFRQAQPTHWSLAHHVHAPAQILYAVRHRIPALVVVRWPEDCVLSQVIRNPNITIRQRLMGYIRFYEPLLSVRSRFESASFDEVTCSFGDTIRRINARYGTRFSEFRHSKDNAAAVIREIEADYLTRELPGRRFEEIVPRPSQYRRQRKKELLGVYRRSSLAPLRARAEGLFDRFVGDGFRPGDDGQN